MKLLLQFFGGRGASSGNGSGSAVAGAQISFNGMTNTYYFYKNGNNNFYQRGFGGEIEPTPNNMSGKEFVERAKSNGADVQTIPAKQVSKQRKDYYNERNNRPDYELGYGTGNMRAYSKQARRNRIATRAMMRK